METPRRWDVVPDDPRDAALLAEGWQRRATKAFVEKDLTGREPQALPSMLRLRSMLDVGRPAFAQLMASAAVGDPFDETTPGSAEEDLGELIQDAGAAFDENSWFEVSDVSGPIGVVLPQIYEDRPSEGTLFYIAVLPERRRDGWGVALHRLGLDDLARRGATRYVGSTDLRNTAMLRVFERNGARQIRTQTFYER